MKKVSWNPAKFIGIYLLVAFFLCLQMFKDLKEANYTAIVLISCFLFGIFLFFFYKMYWYVEYDDEKILVHRSLETITIPVDQLVIIEDRYLAYARGARDVWRFCFKDDSSDENGKYAELPGPGTNMDENWKEFLLYIHSINPSCEFVKTIYRPGSELEEYPIDLEENKQTGEEQRD